MPASGTRAPSAAAVQQPRARRQYFGELIQIDGSEHHWFEDRGPYCTVLTYVDKIKYEGRELGYREFDKLTQTHQGEVVPHKRLGAMLALISENQKYLPQEKRSIKCPTRRYPAPARLT